MPNLTFKSEHIDNDLRLGHFGDLRTSEAQIHPETRSNQYQIQNKVERHSLGGSVALELQKNYPCFNIQNIWRPCSYCNRYDAQM